MVNVTRRGFLSRLGAGTAAATALQFPWIGSTLAASVSRVPNGSTILLNFNENPFGPFPKVISAMRDAAERANRYPDSTLKEFEEQVAAMHKVSSKQVLVGCGSVEILRAATLAFVSPTQKLVMAWPTFEVMAELCKALNAQAIRVPLSSNFAHDLDGMLGKIGSDTGLVYICNPNNPTASLTPREDLEGFISKLPAHTHVLVDEAYHHFATDAKEYKSFLDRPIDNDRVIVARTFSKVYGLAGMRLGYAISSRRAVERIEPFVSSFNTNIAVLRGAMVALQDEAGMRSSVARNAAARDEFIKQARLRKLSPIPSHANFAMMDIGRPVTEAIEYFEQRHIRVGRHFPPMDNYLRISFGRPEEMRAFWRVWDTLPAARGRG